MGRKARGAALKTAVKLMEHEAMRWGYMTEEQMARRIKRITRIEKLTCTIKLAKLYNEKLYRMAMNRKRQLLNA